MELVGDPNLLRLSGRVKAVGDFVKPCLWALDFALQSVEIGGIANRHERLVGGPWHHPCLPCQLRSIGTATELARLRPAGVDGPPVGGDAP